MKMKLSVIIPCYRVEQYLRRCLDSLLAQTLEGVELVCVNDGSPDGCLAILREYERRHGSRIVVIDQENTGVWKARCRGIEAAGGEYIGFVDPDDYVRRDYAEKLYRAARAGNADIACCGFDRIDADSGKRYSREMMKFPCGSFDFRRDPGLMLEVNAALWNKIFRADLLKNMEQIQRIPRVLDDMVFAQLVYLNARTVVFVKEPLVFYMVRGDSIIATLKPEQIPGVYDAMRELRAVYCRKQPDLLLYLDAIAFLHLGISLMHRVSAGGTAALKDALRVNRAFLNETFPRWKNNPYLRLAYVLRHRGANGKTWTVSRFYRLHLEFQFLVLYGWAMDRGVHIKW